MKLRKRIAISIVLIMLLSIVTATMVEAKPNKNVQIVTEFAKKYKKSVKIFNGNKISAKKARKLITHRKGKPYILVEKNVSVSHGRYGLINGKWYIVYNKYVRPGKLVTSYSIYNPHNNAIDDVIAVVDNGKVRCTLRW